MNSEELIKLLIAIVSSLGAIVVALVLALHKGMIKRIETIDLDLKPILRKVDVHDVLIGELKVDSKEMSKRLDHHENRINAIEKKI